MFILVHCYERELHFIGKYETIEAARLAMYADLIVAMEEKDLDHEWIKDIRKELVGMEVFDNVSFEDGSDIGVYADGAWANFREEHYDWKIFNLEEANANE